MEKQELIEKVITQIGIDIKFGDTTALYELLEKLESKYLESYLLEISLDLNKIEVCQDWTATWRGWKTDGWYCIDNGDELFLKDKFTIMPEIIVTKNLSTTTKPTEGYFYLTHEIRENII